MPQKNNFNSTRLSESLMLFSSEEFKSFGKWLQSPWCNTNKKLIELYLFLKLSHPDFNSTKLSKENIFKKLYPSKEFNDRWLRNLTAEMNKQAERFLIHHRLEKEENLKTILLAKEYEKRHQTVRLAKLAATFNKQLAIKKDKSWEDYFYLCYLNDLMYYLPGASHLKKMKEHSLSIADQHLDQFYLLGKWKFRCELNERSKYLNEKKDDSIQIEYLEQLSTQINIPAVPFYQQILKENNAVSTEQFYSLKTDFLHQQDTLSYKDQQLIYLYLLNILIRIYLGGNNQLLPELFDLYRTGIDSQLIIHNGRISDKTFSNIVTTGNSLGEMDYILSFIENYTTYLKPGEQLDGKTWGMAHTYFNQKEFEKSIDLLWPYNFSTPTFELRGKFLLLQSYFEAFRKEDSYISLFFDYCKSLKKFIHRDKNLSVNRKKALYNYIKYSSKIADYIIQKERNINRLLTMVEELDNESFIQGKPRIKKVIDELINGASFNNPIA